MSKCFYYLCLLAVFMCAPVCFGQDDDSSTTPAPVAETEASSDDDVPASQEVEINEDNYRQFMELKDARQQRNMQPETAYQSQSGLQKLDKLPEESQKHLRNQLREIIVERSPWQPGDEDDEYPYVPSEAAGGDKQLRKQEAEAWTELVNGYHQREAEIYAKANRSGAATPSDGAPGGEPGSGDGKKSAGAGIQQDANDARAGGQSNSKQPDGYSPNASNDPSAQSTTGVSQNAMEFLNKMGAGGDKPVGDNSASPAGDARQLSKQAPAGNQMGGDNTSSASPSPSANVPNNANAERPVGATQNAMEYLTGQNTQGTSSTDGSGEQMPVQQQAEHQVQADNTSVTPQAIDGRDADSTKGTSQNALKYLMGADAQPAVTVGEDGDQDQAGSDTKPLPELPSLRGPVSESRLENDKQQTELSGPTSGQGESPNAEPEDTLSIEDLMNAQGVSDLPESRMPSGSPDNDNETAEEDQSAKDEGG